MSLLAPESAPLRVGVSGTPGVGNRLTAVVPPGLVGDFQWTADGDPIAGATGSFYDQTDEDEGRLLRLELRNPRFVSLPVSFGEIGGGVPPGALLLDGQPILLDGQFLVLA